MGERSNRKSRSLSGSPIQAAIHFLQLGGTARAKVTRLEGPISETPQAQYSGRRVTQERVAKPPKLPPKTPMRPGSTQGCSRSQRTAASRSRSSPPPQSWWISFW